MFANKLPSLITGEVLISTIRFQFVCFFANQMHSVYTTQIVLTLSRLLRNVNKQNIQFTKLAIVINIKVVSRKLQTRARFASRGPLLLERALVREK